MGVAKKIGIIILIYLLAGVVWSLLRWQNIIPLSSDDGLEGPLNILYLIFDPVSLIVFMLLGSLGLM
jgi:hypothetical protein